MASPFRPAFELLAQYAEYHRDRRNILTHFIGVPMIVFGIGVLLARTGWPLGGLLLTPAWIVFALAAAWYLTRGEFGLALATTLGVGLLIAAAHQVSGGSTAQWLSWGLGFFVVGWIIQFIGHYYEGRKPAFADDIVGLLVGPEFVVMELLALLGLFKSLIARIESRVGPTLIRDLAHPAT
ncbi:MAG: Mpo1-like protein [Rubrivivax sp.]